jgi:mutator protein MutT
MNRIDVAIAIIHRHGKVLICRRRPGDRLGGYWEFPGGKRERDETPLQTLQRELREELGIQVTPLRQLPSIEYDYPDLRIRLVPFLCDHCSAEPVPIGCEQAIWIEVSALRNYRFPPANAKLIDQVIHALAQQSAGDQPSQRR